MLNIAQETELLSFAMNLRDFLNEEFSPDAPEDNSGDGAYYFRESMAGFKNELNELFEVHFGNA